MTNQLLSVTSYVDPITGHNIVELFLGGLVIAFVIWAALKIWNAVK